MASIIRPISRLAVLRAPIISRAFRPATISALSVHPIRFSSNIPSIAPSPIASISSATPSIPEESASEVLQRKLQEPHYQMSFTCKPCDTRSTHIISKQGYHHGSVLVACPECKARHVISDHLNIFGDKKMTVEDLLREKGETVRKGIVDENGDVEFLGEGEQPRL